jgi:hypothetical protein
MLPPTKKTKTFQSLPKPPKLGPETPLDRRGASYSAGCTQNQPRSTIPRPCRGTANLNLCCKPKHWRRSRRLHFGMKRMRRFLKVRTRKELHLASNSEAKVLPKKEMHTGPFSHRTNVSKFKRLELKDRIRTFACFLIICLSRL